MGSREVQVLIVTDDAEQNAELAAQIVGALDANITIVNTLEEARDMMTDREFDVILASHALSDGSGIELVEDGTHTHQPALMLLQDELNVPRVLGAMRAGATDVFARPYVGDDVVSAIESAVADRRRRRHETNRNRRLRRLSSRLVRDRRELRERVDLICRDLVSAYQRMAAKVVSIEHPERRAGTQQRISAKDV